MRKLHLFSAAALASTVLATPAFAKNDAPTLHGFCASSDPCPDLGANSPTDANPPSFYFSSGGQAETGDVTIDILLPDNLSAPASFTANSGAFVAALVSTTPWTSGQLDTYLGFSAKPTNPIGAYLPYAQGFQPSADGFFVYSLDLGTVTLPKNSDANDSYLLTLDQQLGLGSFIVAFIDEGGKKIGATANSGAIFETGGQTPLPEPATWAMMLAGFGAAGVALRRSRKKELVSQLA